MSRNFILPSPNKDIFQIIVTDLSLNTGLTDFFNSGSLVCSFNVVVRCWRQESINYFFIYLFIFVVQRGRSTSSSPRSCYYKVCYQWSVYPDNLGTLHRSNLTLHDSLWSKTSIPQIFTLIGNYLKYNIQFTFYKNHSIQFILYNVK